MGREKRREGGATRGLGENEGWRRERREKSKIDMKKCRTFYLFLPSRLHQTRTRKEIRV